MQKSVIVRAYWDADGEWTDTTEELNEYLEGGWKVVNVSAMGAFGYGDGPTHAEDNGFASLVIIEK